MTTQRQIEANRRNCEKSSGPRSEAGKGQSRRNAVTHGLTSRTLLPSAIEPLVEERIASFTASFPPETDLDQWYLEQAALESVRIEQAQLQEHALLSHQARRAQSCWHDDRVGEAAKLLAKLPKQPEVILHELEKTTQGCELMIDRWEALQALLQSGKPWNEVHRGMALDLLGVAAAFREVCYADESTVEAQAELVEIEIERLTRRRTEWLDALDADQQEVAIRGLAFPDRAVWLTRRYESASQRRFHFALRHLMAQDRQKGHAVKPAASAGLAVGLIEPQRSDPLEEDSLTIDQLLARMRAEDAVLGKAEPAPIPIPAPLPKPPLDDAFEAALASPSPVPASVCVKGNRRARKSAQRRARRLAV